MFGAANHMFNRAKTATTDEVVVAQPVAEADVVENVVQSTHEVEDLGKDEQLEEIRAALKDASDAVEKGMEENQQLQNTVSTKEREIDELKKKLRETEVREGNLSAALERNKTINDAPMREFLAQWDRADKGIEGLIEPCGTGYFEEYAGKMYDFGLKYGETASGTDTKGRKLLVHYTPFGNVVIFQRYTDGENNVVVCNAPSKVQKLLPVNSDLSSDVIYSIFSYGVKFSWGYHMADLMGLVEEEEETQEPEAIVDYPNGALQRELAKIKK